MLHKNILKKEGFMQPIGVFDSGYGGLTILKEFKKKMPVYDFIYLGDNARTPYGNRSFETIYKYTLQAVEYLFAQNCHLVIIACNTASAKALRTIQQKNLPKIDPNKRVLGVIRPTVEKVGELTKTNHIGILGTVGTVNSESYVIELNKIFPEIKVTQEACPMWVPLVENGETNNEGADYFIKKHIRALLDADKKIDTIILGCTHYPLLMNLIQKNIPSGIKVIAQNEISALSLIDYLNRHPEIDTECSKNSSVKFLTTDSTEIFNQRGQMFFNEKLVSEKIILD